MCPTLRVRNEQNRSVCSISGVNPDMSASDAAGFVTGIQEMYAERFTYDANNRIRTD